MTGETYRNYLKIKEHLDKHARAWEYEEGLGRDLIEDARLAIVSFAIDDTYNNEDVVANITDLLGLIRELDDHQDDYVRAIYNPMGGFEITEALQGSEDE